MATKPKPTRGGARPGSGPKPLPPGHKKLCYAAKLSQDVIAFLRSRKDCDPNAAQLIERLIRQSPEFDEWRYS